MCSCLLFSAAAVAVQPLALSRSPSFSPPAFQQLHCTPEPIGEPILRDPLFLFQNRRSFMEASSDVSAGSDLGRGSGAAEVEEMDK